MLLPALNQARERAKAIKCVSNEKQMGTAMSMYCQDYTDWLLVDRINNPTGNLMEWRRELAPYIYSSDNWSDADWSSRKLREGTFACPSFKNPAINNPEHDGGYGWAYLYMGLNATDRKKIVQVKQPSNTIAVGDTTDWYGNNSERLARLYCPSYGNFSPPVGNRHSGSINILWVDGHVLAEGQKKLLAGVGGDEDWYYKADKP
jgi:prepilin-type processing-associated H-X9-DG protein